MSTEALAPLSEEVTTPGVLSKEQMSEKIIELTSKVGKLENLAERAELKDDQTSGLALTQMYFDTRMDRLESLFVKRLGEAEARIDALITDFRTQVLQSRQK